MHQRRHLGFFEEAALRNWILRLQQNLDGQRSIKVHVPGLVDDTHSALGEPRLNQVALPKYGAQDRVLLRALCRYSRGVALALCNRDLWRATGMPFPNRNLHSAARAALGK